MFNTIEKKRIMITGCTSGIGMESACYLKQQGYGLMLIGRNESKLRELSEKLENEPFYVCDLTHLENIKGIFTFCKENNIMLDGLVHAAGCGLNVPIKNYSIEEMEKQMKVHYCAFIELCKFFSSKKYSNNGASIVAISSLATETNLKGTVTYSASKAALNSAVSVASKEFVKRKIRVNAIMPANVDTRLSSELDDWIDISQSQPLGLIPKIDIVYAIEFLLSDKSSYITGAFLPISAGMEY